MNMLSLQLACEWVSTDVLGLPGTENGLPQLRTGEEKKVLFFYLLYGDVASPQERVRNTHLWSAFLQSSSINAFIFSQNMTEYLICQSTSYLLINWVGK